MHQFESVKKIHFQIYSQLTHLVNCFMFLPNRVIFICSQKDTLSDWFTTDSLTEPWFMFLENAVIFIWICFFFGVLLFYKGIFLVESDRLGCFQMWTLIYWIASEENNPCLDTSGKCYCKICSSFAWLVMYQNWNSCNIMMAPSFRHCDTQ